MQEEVENRTVVLMVNGTKFTGRLLKGAIEKYMGHRKEKKLQKEAASQVSPKGKQSVKDLVGQSQRISVTEIDDPSIREFDRITRKYGVDYAVRRDTGTQPPKFLIFFKARDAEVLHTALAEYTVKKNKEAGRMSVAEYLQQHAMEQAPAVHHHNRQKGPPVR